MTNASNSITATAVQFIDTIIDKASLEPDAVLAEYASRDVRQPDGRLLATLDDVREHVSAAQADALARSYVRTYAKMAAAQGFATGLGGILTLPVTVPADAAAYVAWLVRCGSAIQLAFGQETRTETGDAQLKLAMLAGAGVSEVTINGTKILVTQFAKKVSKTPYAKAPIQAAMKTLAAKAGIQLTHKSFAKAVPVLGGVINGAAQGSMVKVAGGRIRVHYSQVAATA
jgi:hypothetical protein